MIIKDADVTGDAAYFCLGEDGTCLDPLQCLPIEINLRIFSSLSNEDLFLKCSVVSKNWQLFLDSDLFWKNLIHKEFGHSVCNRFLNSPEALQNFKTSLRESVLFRMDGCCQKTMWDCKQKIPDVVKDVGDFISLARELFPNFAESSFDAIRSDGSYYWWIFRVPASAFDAIDILKLPLIFEPREEWSSWYNRDLYLLDKDFQIIEKIQYTSSYDQSLFLHRNYPSGMRYVVAKAYYRNPFEVRIVFPSTARSLSLTFRLERAYSVEEMKRLLEEEPSLVSQRHYRSKFADTPFGKAMKHEYLIVSLFIKYGAKVTDEAAVLAARCNYVSAMEVFLDRGLVDPNKLIDGKPLLSYASYRSSMISLLIERGADVNQTDENGDTPLINAIRHSDLMTVSCLISRGADVNRLNWKLQSPLQIAMLTPVKYPPMIQRVDMLLHADADPNVRFYLDNGLQSTALIMATRQQNEEVAQLLLKFGADKEATDSKNLTAFDHAELNDFHALLNILR